MPHVLSVSYDAILLSTRQMLLESRGYTVTSAEGYVDALRKMSRWRLRSGHHRALHSSR